MAMKARVSPLLAALLLVLLWLGIPLGSESANGAAAASAKIDPEIDRLFEEAFAATNRGDFARAEAFWSQLLQRQPDNPALWSNRGNARVSKKKK